MVNFGQIVVSSALRFNQPDCQSQEHQNAIKTSHNNKFHGQCYSNSRKRKQRYPTTLSCHSTQPPSAAIAPACTFHSACRGLSMLTSVFTDISQPMGTSSLFACDTSLPKERIVGATGQTFCQDGFFSFFNRHDLC